MSDPPRPDRPGRHQRDVGLGLVGVSLLAWPLIARMENTGTRFELELVQELCFLLGLAAAARGWWRMRRP